MLWLDPRAYRNERIVRRPGGAARCGSLRGDDGGVSVRAAIGSQKHLALPALHAAGRRVAVGAKDANARRRARWTGIARWDFSTRRSLITHWAFSSWLHMIVEPASPIRISVPAMDMALTRGAARRARDQTPVAPSIRLLRQAGGTRIRSAVSGAIACGMNAGGSPGTRTCASRNREASGLRPAPP